MSQCKDKTGSTTEHSWQDQAIRKVTRLRRARRQRDEALHALAQVGSLAWVFVLPVLAAGWIAHVVLRQTSQRWLAVPMLLIGVLTGGGLVRRKIRQLLERERNDDLD